MKLISILNEQDKKTVEAGLSNLSQLVKQRKEAAQNISSSLHALASTVRGIFVKSSDFAAAQNFLSIELVPFQRDEVLIEKSDLLDAICAQTASAFELDLDPDTKKDSGYSCMYDIYLEDIQEITDSLLDSVTVQHIMQANEFLKQFQTEIFFKQRTNTKVTLEVKILQ